MQLRRNTYFTLTFTLTIICNCQKRFEIRTSETSSIALPSVDTTLVIPTSDSYLPLAKNNFWKYRDTASGESTIISVTGIQQLINSKNYQVINGSIFTGPMFFTVNDHDHFIYHELSGVFVEILFLKNHAAVGVPWSAEMGMLNGSPARGIGSIIQRDLKMRVEGKTYENVIHTYFHIDYDIAGVPYTYGGYDYYTAKGIGIVKIEANFGLFDTSGTQILYSNTKNLVDLSIK